MQWITFFNKLNTQVNLYKALIKKSMGNSGMCMLLEDGV